MILESVAVLAFAARCAPAVAPPTLLAVARAESGLNPYAIGVNAGPSLTHPPQTLDAAIAIATSLHAAGANFDLGLTQINSANLGRLGLTAATAFDPCRNLAAGAAVLKDAYASAHTALPDPQLALRAALSVYNTGDRSRGLRNGYVTRVVKAAANAQNAAPDRVPEPPTKPAVAWDVFGDLRPAGAAFSLPLDTQGSLP